MRYRNPIERLRAARAALEAAEEECRLADIAVVMSEHASTADTVRPPAGTSPDLDGGWE